MKVRAPQSMENMDISWSPLLVAFYRLTSSDRSIQTSLETQKADREELQIWKVIFPKCQSIYSKYSRSRETSLVMNYVEQNKVGYVLVLHKYKA